ncbi:MAG TPA: hypothetical protein VHC97_20875 [Thermoanaerobaculia bacterium]|jgi:hypothetical protein|nr:hypothetical protein [Thermoanaerobaculia bacterium]
MKYPRIILLVLSAFTAIPALAEDGLAFQASLGAAESLETSLTIRQSGFADIDLDADYETQPFTDPVYYSLRAGWWRGRSGWEFEVIHHKLILQNPPPELRSFQISHGYNYVTVNRGWDLGRLLLRVGAGAILAHPEGSVRGRSINPENEYHWTGPAFQVGVEKRFALRERWLLGVEGKLSAARAVIPIPGGEVDAPNVAAHVLVGFGYRYPTRRP